ncbi:MAG: type IV pilin [Candidatus Heimdallarchaeota archaeon]|nr:type IV pilin [Candidatus Heimdallarchaeota archaeon]
MRNGCDIRLIQYCKKIYHRKKAISPVIAAILLIALTVTAVAIVYFLVIPMFNKTQLSAEIYRIKDINRDSLYDQITLQVANSGTRQLNITDIIIWTCAESDLGNDDAWVQHTDWTFENPGDSLVNPSEIDEITLSGTSQIGLTIKEQTYYRLEITYSGQSNPLITNWALLNDQVDLTDLIASFETFDLQALAFEGTIDDPNRAANNYRTSGGDYSLTTETNNFLPVLNETELIPFYLSGGVVVFHSPNGNLSSQPLEQVLDFSSNIFRARKLFLLGLAGSWGDEFPGGAWALKVTITYTDDTTTSWELGHDYIDDWWYQANSGDDCDTDPEKATEIDLGTQIDTPNSHIHTHTTRFYLDFYKYVKSITFEDPGTDDSAPHLLSITFG